MKFKRHLVCLILAASVVASRAEEEGKPEETSPPEGGTGEEVESTVTAPPEVAQPGIPDEKQEPTNPLRNEDNPESVHAETTEVVEVTTEAVTATTEAVVVTTTAVEETTEMVEITTPENDDEEEFGFAGLFGGLDWEEGDKEKLKAEGTTTEAQSEVKGEEVTAASEKEKAARLSEQIRTVLKNYKEYGSVTFPGNPLPDPMSIPDIRKSFAGNPVNFTGIFVHGLSKFDVDHVNTDLEKMQVFVALNINRLILLGNYSLKSWFGKGAGPFNITLLSVVVSGSAQLRRNEEGNLEATDSEMDMSFRDSIVDFKNVGMLGSLLQGVLASAGPVLFEAVKPIILKEVNDKIRGDMNKRIENIGQKLGDTRPLDKAVAEGRKYVKENGYDPYHLKDYVVREGAFVFNVSDLWLLGLSRFYRVGDVSLSMDAGNIQAGVHLVTGKLYGKCKWNITLGSFFREGAANFTVNQLQARAIVNQSLDVSRHPVLDDLDIHLGKPEVRMESKDKIDIMIEIAINSLPLFLRHILVDALEEPIKQKVQTILNDIDVEEFVEKNLPELDNMGL